MCCLPFAVANIRAEVATTLFATDATPSRGGAVSSEVDNLLAEKLYTLAEQRGCLIRLDGKAILDDKGEERLMPSTPLVDDLVLSLPWVEVASPRAVRETVE